MGLVMARISLKNPIKSDLEPLKVEALADSRAIHLCIPEHIKIQLQLEVFDHKEVILADGSCQVIPYNSPNIATFIVKYCNKI